MATETETDDGMDLGDETASAFLENLIGDETEKTKEAAKADPEPAETDAETETEETDEETDADEPEADDKAAETDPDDAEVDLGSDKKAKLRELKAAFTAQAETTAARDAANQLRAQAEAQANLAKSVLNKGLERAEARWKPFAELDFLALSRDPTIDAETFAALRKEAAEALTDVKFHREELAGVQQALDRDAHTRRSEEAAATVAALSHAETGIKGWDQKLYGELLSYAGTELKAPPGAPQAVVAEWALRALHKAMLYDRGVKQAAAQIEKVAKKPTRVLQSSKGDGRVTPGTASKSALAALRKSGSVDDAADAFFASFGADE